VSEIPNVMLGGVFISELFTEYLKLGVETELFIQYPDGRREIRRLTPTCSTEVHDVTDPETRKTMRYYNFKCTILDTSPEAYTITAIIVRRSSEPYTHIFTAFGISIPKPEGATVEFTFTLSVPVPREKVFG